MRNKALITCVFCLSMMQPCDKVGDSDECRKCKRIKERIYKNAYMKGYNKGKRDFNAEKTLQ